MSELELRGAQLRKSGLTSLRAFRLLRAENPWAETDTLWAAVGERPSGVFPMWADRSSPKPAFYRNDTRK